MSRWHELDKLGQTLGPSELRSDVLPETEDVRTEDRFVGSERLRFQLANQHVVPLLASSRLGFKELSHATHYWLTSNNFRNYNLPPVPSYPDEPGSYRTNNRASVGTPYSEFMYFPPHYTRLDELMTTWAHLVDGDENSLMNIAKGYLFYVALHPQSDTVGRNARLLTNIQLSRVLNRTIWFDDNWGALGVLQRAKNTWFKMLSEKGRDSRKHGQFDVETVYTADLLSELLQFSVEDLNSDFNDVFVDAGTALTMYLE